MDQLGGIGAEGGHGSVVTWTVALVVLSVGIGDNVTLSIVEADSKLLGFEIALMSAAVMT
jgi:hypothetical protein